MRSSPHNLPRATAVDAEMKVWKVKELQTFFASQRESRPYPLWRTLATPRMRRGEALGVRWEEVDLEAQTIAIRQTRIISDYQPLLSTPKARGGQRLVALDPATVATLKGRERSLASSKRCWTEPEP